MTRHLDSLRGMLCMIKHAHHVVNATISCSLYDVTMGRSTGFDALTKHI